MESVWEDVLHKEYDVIEGAYREVGPGCRFLEIGCGALGFLRRQGDRLCGLYPSSIGVDIDRQGLSENEQVNHRVCASCYSLPLRSNSVDIIACLWLFEHLAHPETAMQEISRVLAKGGYLFIRTPNLLNYVILVSKLTPISFHNLLKSLSAGRENIQAFYRANTLSRIVKLASEHDLTVEHVEFAPYAFLYYAFNRWLFLAMKRLSGPVSRIAPQVHLKLTCLMKKAGE